MKTQELVCYRGSGMSLDLHLNFPKSMSIQTGEYILGHHHCRPKEDRWFQLRTPVQIDQEKDKFKLLIHAEQFEINKRKWLTWVYFAPHFIILKANENIEEKQFKSNPCKQIFSVKMVQLVQEVDMKS